MTTRLSTDEKQGLLGPTVVGALFGGLAAAASVAFDLEYGLHVSGGSMPLTTTQLTIDAAVAVLCVTAATVLLLGVLPIVVRRVLARKSRKLRHE